MLGKVFGLGLAQLTRIGLGYNTPSVNPFPSQDWQVEENTDVWLLEDGSGSWLLEES